MAPPRMVTIYRYENAHGHGPYTAPGFGGAVAGLHDAHGPDTFGHPGPYDDRGLTPDRLQTSRFRVGMRFGFASKAAARRWMSGFARALTAAGYHLYAYRVPEHAVTRGARQVVITRDAYDRARAARERVPW